MLFGQFLLFSDLLFPYSYHPAQGKCVLLKGKAGRLVLLMVLYCSLWIEKYTFRVNNKVFLYCKLLNHETQNFSHYFYAKTQTLSNPGLNCLTDTLKKGAGEVG